MLGGEIISVDPRGTSQEWPECGQVSAFPRTLKERWHRCDVLSHRQRQVKFLPFPYEGSDFSLAGYRQATRWTDSVKDSRNAGGPLCARPPTPILQPAEAID